MLIHAIFIYVYPFFMSFLSDKENSCRGMIDWWLVHLFRELWAGDIDYMTLAIKISVFFSNDPQHSMTWSDVHLSGWTCFWWCCLYQILSVHITGIPQGPRVQGAQQQKASHNGSDKTNDDLQIFKPMQCKKGSKAATSSLWIFWNVYSCFCRGI